MGLKYREPGIKDLSRRKKFITWTWRITWVLMPIGVVGGAYLGQVTKEGIIPTALMFSIPLFVFAKSYEKWANGGIETTPWHD